MPPDNFGPWTTSLTTGSRLELSAFWKRRLARLSDAANSTRRLSLRHVGLLGCGIMLLAVAPHWDRQVLSASIIVTERSDSAEIPKIPGNGVDRAVIEKSRRVRALLDEPSTADFNDVALAEALRRLSAFHKFDIRFDLDAIKLVGRSLVKAATSVQFSGISLRSALKLILEPEALDYYIEGGELVVTSRGNAWFIEEDYDIRGLVRAGIRPADLAAAIPFLIVPVSWEDAGGAGELKVNEQFISVVQRREVRASLRSLLDSIQQSIRQLRGPLDDLTASTRRYSIADLRRQGLPDEELHAHFDGTLMYTLRLDRPTGVRHEITGDELVVVNQSQWGHQATGAFLSELRALRGDAPVPSRSVRDFWRAAQGIDVEARRRTLLRALQQPVAIDLVEIPFPQALHSLVKVGRFNLVVDPEIHKPGTLSPTTPVTLHAKDEACSTILDRFCSQLGLVWSVHDEVVWIASADVKNVRKLQRAYSTKALVAAGRTDQEIARTILEEIEPQTWGSNSDKGRLYPLPGVIVVTHNEGVQRQVESWLELQRKKRNCNRTGFFRTEFIGSLNLEDAIKP